MNRLGRFAITISGSGFPHVEQGSVAGEFPFLKVSDLADPKNANGVTTAANWVSSAQVKSLGARLVPVGAVVFPKVGAALLGNARATTSVVVAMDNNMMAVVPRYGVDRYWYYLMSSVDMADLNQSGTLPFVTDRAVRDLVLQVDAPKDQQQRIADFLDDQVARIDNIIAARRGQATLLEADRRVETVSLVFAADIPMTRLGYVADVDHGRQRSPKDAEGPYMTHYVRSANVKDGEISDDDIQLMNFTPVEKLRYGLQRGDTLITEASGSVDSIGASAQWLDQIDGPVCFQNHLLRVRANQAVAHPDYLEVWARASYYSGAMRIWASGANILNLGSETLRQMPVPVRSLSHQDNLVAECVRVERHHRLVIGSVAESIEKLSEMKRSLITAAVTGDFDVSTADGSRVPL